MIAEAYANVLRLQDLKRGLSPRFTTLIASAGTDVSSRDYESPERQKVSRPALDALFVVLPHDRDIAAIEADMYEHRSKGVEAKDFVDYDYIFAFDDVGLQRLETLRARAERQRENGLKAKCRVLGDRGGVLMPMPMQEPGAGYEGFVRWMRREMDWVFRG